MQAQGKWSGHRISSGVAGGNGVEDILAATCLSERANVICKVFLLGFLVQQGVFRLQFRVLEVSDKISLGANVSLVTARDRVRGIERIKRKVINFLPIVVTRNLAGNVFYPSKNLMGKTHFQQDSGLRQHFQRDSGFYPCENLLPKGMHG